MSVRMAMAKLCACACGGAVIGGGAVHVAESPKRAPHFTKQVKPIYTKPVRRIALARPAPRPI
ncbi:MAG: PEP-CTERM sorting domain-containing protein, partial [Lysobacteraceae bacterium]